MSEWLLQSLLVAVGWGKRLALPVGGGRAWLWSCADTRHKRSAAERAVLIKASLTSDVGRAAGR